MSIKQLPSRPSITQQNVSRKNRQRTQIATVAMLTILLYNFLNTTYFSFICIGSAIILGIIFILRFLMEKETEIEIDIFNHRVQGNIVNMFLLGAMYGVVLPLWPIIKIVGWVL